MLLSELKKGESGLIIKIHADSQLRNRLHSFGIIPGEELKLKEYSIANQTMEIEVERTLIALRKEEAQKIEIEPI